VKERLPIVVLWVTVLVLVYAVSYAVSRATESDTKVRKSRANVSLDAIMMVGRLNLRFLACKTHWVELAFKPSVRGKFIS